jgi:hypothetical protein
LIAIRKGQWNEELDQAASLRQHYLQAVIDAIDQLQQHALTLPDFEMTAAPSPPASDQV